MKYVIAGTYAEFRACCLDNNWTRKDAVYVDSADKLRGIHVPINDIVQYGSHYRRPDIEELLFAANCAIKRHP